MSVAIKLKPQAKAEFQRLFLEAVQLQVQLYNKLSEIEAIDGVSALAGLDAAVQQEASDWMDAPSALPDDTFRYVLATVRREK